MSASEGRMSDEEEVMMLDSKGGTGTTLCSLNEDPLGVDDIAVDASHNDGADCCRGLKKGVQVDWFHRVGTCTGQSRSRQV